MTPDEARELIEGWHAGGMVDWDSSREALETLAGMKTEAQYHRNYETGRFERHTRVVGEWVKNDD